MASYWLPGLGARRRASRTLQSGWRGKLAAVGASLRNSSASPTLPAITPCCSTAKKAAYGSTTSLVPTHAVGRPGRRYSIDDGKTWSATEHLPAGLYGPIRAKPLVMTDGTIVSGTSVESYHTWAAWIERSSDNGETWRRIGPITVPQTNAPPNETYGIIQPSVISLGGQHLRFYARSTALIGRICIADSIDAGITWSQAGPLDLPNPNSGIDAVALHDGRIVLIFNNTTVGRTPLNLAVSKDGEHFRIFQTLEDSPGEFSYPSLIQGRDGDLHITYTWNRKRIRYARIPLGDVPAENY